MTLLTSVTRTLRLKVKSESYSWLKAAAVEVNQVWNWANEVSYKARRPFSGPGKWLSRVELCALSSGATEGFQHIGADTIQRICYEYVAKRTQACRAKLRWRVSRGARKSLGWIPFKATSLRRAGKYVRFCGKTIRVFESERLKDLRWGVGCFAQDAVGDWWLCLSHEIGASHSIASHEAVGIDLGLKDIAVTSEAERLAAGCFYRGLEADIAQAQRRGHKRQAKRLHRRAANRRRDALHQFSRKIVDRYQNIYVGDVSSLTLAKTPMAKSVLDAGWGLLKMQLQYKGQQAGRCVEIVSERNTTRGCSRCGALTGPSGLRDLVVRQWVCSGCGAEHERDVNAARNLLTVGSRCATSVRGNKPNLKRAVEPSNKSSMRDTDSTLEIAA